MSSISALIDVFKKFWPHIVTAVTFGIMIWTAGHVLLRKRDTKAATGWIGLILFSPPLLAQKSPLFLSFMGSSRLRRSKKDLEKNILPAL